MVEPISQSKDVRQFLTQLIHQYQSGHGCKEPSKSCSINRVEREQKQGDKNERV